MISYFLRTFVNIYSFLIILYIGSSWFPVWRNSVWYSWIDKITAPYLNLFRKWIPRIGMIDISPVVALIWLSFFPRILLWIISFILINILNISWLQKFL